MSISVSIDGVPVSTEEGRLLIDVAADHGVYIPTLCHLKNRSPLGTCRVCLVRVDGMVMTGCTVAVRDGMRVEVAAPDLIEARAAIVEMLFSEGNHSCPSCEKSGRCQLQAVGYDMEVMVSRFPYRYPVRTAQRAAQFLWLDRDRCIFCQRCVEFVRDGATGRRIFTIVGRGPAARIEVDAHLADAMTAQEVKRAVALCPVGAILEKGVGHDEPMGRRKYEIRTIRERALGSEA